MPPELLNRINEADAFELLDIVLKEPILLRCEETLKAMRARNKLLASGE
jgi:hypothetical protein